jgi:hypothetical protein
MQNDDIIWTIEKSKSVKKSKTTVALAAMKPYVLIVADFSLSTNFFGAFAADDVTAPVPDATAPNKESKSSITAAIWNLQTGNRQKANSA